MLVITSIVIIINIIYVTIHVQTQPHTVNDAIVLHHQSVLVSCLQLEATHPLRIKKIVTCVWHSRHPWAIAAWTASSCHAASVTK